MIQSAVDTYLFRLGRPAYKHNHTLGWLWCIGFLAGAITTLLLSLVLLPTYAHTFTPYLRWQDALVAFLWFVTLLCLSGCIFGVRYLKVLHTGYTKELLTITDGQQLTVRDLSPDKLTSFFWMLYAAFWCFMVVLVGLLPEMLIGWTLHLPSLPLVILATGVATLLSLAGLALSVTFGWFILMGAIGAIPLFNKFGAVHTYKLDSHTVLRIDEDVLTVIYPGRQEAMIDLKTLDKEDLAYLMPLIHGYVIDTQGTLSEIEAVIPAKVGAKRTAVLV
jgi:MFS family permease